jgi:hypothetical protein
MKPTARILGIHLPPEETILLSDPADTLEKDDVLSPFETYFRRSRDG